MGVLECNIVHRRFVAMLCMLFKMKCNPINASFERCITFAVCAGACSSWCFGCLCVLLVVRLCFVAVELLSIAGILCPSQCLFGTFLLTLCSMVWDWRVLKAKPMLSCCPNLLSFVFYYFIFFLHELVVWVEVFGLIECSLSPYIALLTNLNNNNNKCRRKKIMFSNFVSNAY